ncbi:MAG: hypothetical protein IID03_09645 [Candidatus Dadabacteria bacterium]|nr:hypothetical protein [Candidatus Dadabacteria bacterium]
MPSLKELNDLLRDASKSLDLAAKQIRDIPLDPKKDNIRTIGNVLTEIFKLKHKIYELEPELMPEKLKYKSKYTGDNNKYGKVLISAEDFKEQGKIGKAIQVYEDYIKTDPPEYFKDMALSELENINKFESSEK